MSVINTNTDSVIGTIPVGLFPFSVDINENMNLVYVANANGHDVTIIDGNTDTVLDTVSVGNSPLVLAVHETTGFIYVTNRNDGTVSVINPISNTVTDTITVLQFPSEVKIDESTNRAFVGSANTAEITAINTITNQVITTLIFDWPTEAIEVNECTNRLYVSQTGQFDTDFRGILVMDLTSFATLDTITSKFGPSVLDANFLTSRMYGTNHQDGEVFVYEIEGCAIGGEIIPIETTSLLLAGAQSFSWMIPVLLSGIGIGLFVFRKSENS